MRELGESWGRWMAILVHSSDRCPRHYQTRGKKDSRCDEFPPTILLAFNPGKQIYAQINTYDIGKWMVVQWSLGTTVFYRTWRGNWKAWTSVTPHNLVTWAKEQINRIPQFPNVFFVYTLSQPHFIFWSFYSLLHILSVIIASQKISRGLVPRGGLNNDP